MAVVSAPILYRQLNGVFAVYKHSGVSAAQLGRTILVKLLEDLGSLEQRPQKPMIKYMPRQSAELEILSSSSPPTTVGSLLPLANTKALARRVPVNVTDWFDHALVQGPRYDAEDFELSVGQILDKKSSGIQLYGLQWKGRTFLRKLQRYSIPRSYHLHGRFGQASLQYDGEAKVVERSTWDHITEAKISRLLCRIQGEYRNALMKSSNLDMDSQLAYEKACEGLLKPQVPTGSMILDIKLKKLNLPEFVVDITCINESCQFLRQLVHEIGLELRSSAVCLKVRRYRDALFFAEDESTLLSRDVAAQRLVDVMTETNTKLSSLLVKKPSVFMGSRVSYTTTERDEFSMEDAEAID